MFDYNIEIIRF